MKYLPLLLTGGLALTACSPAQQSQPAPETAQKAAAESTDMAFNPNYRDYLKTLASDEFGGRAPATEGEEMTVSFIENHFREWGLKPFNSEQDSYRQSVPLVKLIPYKVSSLTLNGAAGEHSFGYRTQMNAWTPRVTDRVDVTDSDVVFVGYGIVAPEYDWNDYEGVDVTGKTVVMFVNDPGYATEDESLFTGKAMTYYGRWTYKFEEAARQGAKAAIIIHETGPAGYGWGVVAGGSPVRFDLARDNKNMDRAEVEGWINSEAAESLFADMGTSLAAMHERALGDDFKAMPLDLKASVTIDNKYEYLESDNVIGYIEGSKYPEEHVIYMAHWDHLGSNPINPDDKIYNGAQDDATGTAGVMAIAEQFAKAEQPERSIVFITVTAEERGLLGSAWYAEHPLLPLEKAVGGINMDMMNVYGPMKDMVVIGYGNSQMDDLLNKYVQQQDRYIAPEPTPEAGLFYRSDHFNLAKKGVPVLFARGGDDHFEKGKEYGAEQMRNFIANDYHKPSDEYREDFDLRGIQQNLAVFYRMGDELANSRSWPQWTEGNEFKPVREQSAQQRQSAQ
ncbi:M28 family metallopeptidase [Idiomarina xiamenensis]|uniref:Aminopeptidase n=1 Tax=Idiomarina xiamenensis 10-D-4 TaxID=740709 RepID=K2L4I4_9GAMM|nr:M28 family metallopeptidase [Idiomarina xiamenensis]EKE84725.1 aminopeptidase [Idiomarina xiamenensis 10-D-4]